MAVVNRLATKDQTTVYDFATRYLVPQTMTRVSNGDGWLTTTYTLVGRSSDTNILSSANALSTFAYWAEDFWNDLHVTKSIWLEENATSETTKRSLIQSIELTPIQIGNMGPTLGKTGAMYTLVIIHSAAWENTTAASVTNLYTSVLGGKLVLPGIDGSLGGRIYQTYLNTVTNTTASNIWMGIRSTNHGTTDFVSLWELEKGDLLGGAALGSDSDNASPLGTTNNIVTYDCTTDDVKFLSISVEHVMATTDLDATHFEGDYQILLRAKLSAAQTVRLQLATGFTGNVINEYVDQYKYISGTDWHLYEMGVIGIPGYPHNPTPMEDFRLRLYAKLIGTATTLSVDCFILIPSQHYMKIIDSVGDGDQFHVYESDDGLYYGYGYDGGILRRSIAFSNNNWEYPMGGGVLILASEDTTGSSIIANENELTSAVYYYERFRTHGE